MLVYVQASFAFSGRCRSLICFELPATPFVTLFLIYFRRCGKFLINYVILSICPIAHLAGIIFHFTSFSDALICNYTFGMVSSSSRSSRTGDGNYSFSLYQTIKLINEILLTPPLLLFVTAVVYQTTP